MADRRPAAERYIALLRGVNVGGHKHVAMSDLRDILASLGHADVSTYLNSGNALFTTERTDTVQITNEIEGAIAGQLGFDVRVVLRTPRELKEAVEGDPMPEATAEPSRYLVTFLSTDPDEDRIRAFDVAGFAPDEIRFGPRTVYIWYRAGVGRSKLNGDVLERRLGVIATARNWNTVLKLLELATPAQQQPSS